MKTKTFNRKHKKVNKKSKKSMFGVLKEIHEEFEREEIDRFS